MGNAAGFGARCNVGSFETGGGGNVDTPDSAPGAVACAARGCRRTASIIHSGIPYCGTHALRERHREQLESESEALPRRRLSIRAD
jgi:hypothetical protein